MSKRLPILITGILPPSLCPSASITVQTALAFTEHHDVTIVIDTAAPPPNVFEHHSSIKTIRVRDLKTHAARYQNHLRLFILGDSAESLFAIELYQLARGLVIPTSGSLNFLFQHYLKCATNWPENYAQWLRETLGETGDIMADGIVRRHRISKNIVGELPAPWANHSETEATFVGEADVYPLSAPPIGECRDPLQISPVHEPAPEIQKRLVVLHAAGGAVKAAIKTLDDLHAQKPTSLQFIQISGAEQNLGDLVAAADAVLIAEQTNMCPPVLVHALRQGKAIITCGQLWAHSVPATAALKIDHPDALHQMVAAIGALYQLPDLRAWYAENAQAATDVFDAQASAEHLLAALQKNKQLTLDLHASPAPAQTHTIKPIADNTQQQLQEGAPRSVALIGATPPRQILAKLFPQVAWDSSPRFATPGLVSALCSDAPQRAAIKLALLGYQSVLVAPDTDVASAPTRQTDGYQIFSWPDLKPLLRETNEALSFGYAIDDSVHADQHMTPGCYLLDLPFSASDITGTNNSYDESGVYYDENSGLFCQLDRVRHQLDCLLIAGICGQYSLTQKATNTPFMVADGAVSGCLSNEQSVILTTDDHGILSFSMKALDPAGGWSLESETLIKMLAESDIKLEWLSHG